MKILLIYFCKVSSSRYLFNSLYIFVAHSKSYLRSQFIELQYFQYIMFSHIKYISFSIIYILQTVIMEMI